MKNTLLKLLLLTLIFNFSCEKEDQQNLVEQSKEQFNAANLEAAKEFYNQNHTNTASTSRTTETTSVTDWDRSTSKNYKQTEEISVDILYTPLYLRTQFNAKAFIASTEYQGVVDAKKLYVLYKDSETTDALSAYIIIYNLDGTFYTAYNFENGIEIPFPTQNTASSRTEVDCSDTDVSSMDNEEFEQYLANCYSPLPQVTVVAIAGTDGSAGGGPTGYNPFDNSNNWVGVEFPIGDPNGYNAGTTNGSNPQVFTPNSVSASAMSISIAIDALNSQIHNWLQYMENQQNYVLLQSIANYLNAHKERPSELVLDDGFGDDQFPNIQQQAIDLVLEFINANSNNEIDEEILDCIYNNGSIEFCTTWTEPSQGRRNLLCGTFNFITIGNASVANISGLGLSLSRGYSSSWNTEFNQSMCITIANTIPAHASAMFNNAWNLTMQEVLSYVNLTHRYTTPNYEEIKSLIIALLNQNIKIASGNVASSVSRNPCMGSVPTTSASDKYCP